MKSSAKLVFLSLAALLVATTVLPLSRAQAAVYPRLETSFQLPNLATDPFDYEKTDVRVQIRRARGGTVALPAFFDGGTTWRARHTPTLAGRYSVAGITLNGRAVSAVAQPNQWRISGAPNSKLPGFVRLDPRNASRLTFDNGAPYFPLGHNQAWHSDGLPDIPVLFGKMGAAGENWSRVWMNHWDGKNLDWTQTGKPGPFGTLSLDVARRWDGIVGAAETNGIAFQMVFQHHGQYSSQVNPNWDDNPYNVKNGGFLATPGEFFTNAQAKSLTKRKLRYSVARWGYSPSILAWELFNEVQFTDAARAGDWNSVAAWHREMADFLRAQDPYHHLITTSSTESVPKAVWDAVDYYQEHTYPIDVITALGTSKEHADWPRKPYFVGEFGPSGVNDPSGNAIHGGIWAGLMSGQAGAPQFWTWDDVEKNDLYFHFRAATGFVKASGLANQTELQKTAPSVATSTYGDLSFGPGGDWGPVKQFEFTVQPSGPPEGIGALSRYLQGDSNRALEPQPLTFKVDFARAGRFIVQIGEVAKGGAHVALKVDGQAIERDFPASDVQVKPSDDAGRLAVDVPAGAHTISLQNTGADWAAIRAITLTDYAPVLGAYGLGGDSYAAAWLYNRVGVTAMGAEPGAATGTLALTGLKAGRYHATWWDTRRGAAITTVDCTVAANQPLMLATPGVTRDVAVFVTRG